MRGLNTLFAAPLLAQMAAATWSAAHVFEGRGMAAREAEADRVLLARRNLPSFISPSGTTGVWDPITIGGGTVVPTKTPGPTAPIVTGTGTGVLSSSSKSIIPPYPITNSTSPAGPTGTGSIISPSSTTSKAPETITTVTSTVYTTTTVCPVTITTGGSTITTQTTSLTTVTEYFTTTYCPGNAESTPGPVKPISTPGPKPTDTSGEGPLTTTYVTVYSYTTVCPVTLTQTFPVSTGDAHTAYTTSVITTSTKSLTTVTSVITTVYIPKTKTLAISTKATVPGYPTGSASAPSGPKSTGGSTGTVIVVKPSATSSLPSYATGGVSALQAGSGLAALGALAAFLL